MEQKWKNDRAGFLIFTFSFDIIHSLSLYILVQEAIQSQCLPPTLYVNLIATYISGVRIKHAYMHDDTNSQLK